MVKESWSSLPLDEEMEQVNALLERLEVYKKDDGVNGVGVVRSFVGRRIQPIKERVHLAFDYDGTQDTTRESPKLWKKDALDARVASLFQGDVKVSAAKHSPGYHLRNPPDQVCSFAELFRLLFFE